MDGQALEQQYPSNSNSHPTAYNKVQAVKKSEDPVVKKVEKVTKGLVTKKKKTLGEKFKETFLAIDMHSVAEHIIFDVLIPTAKSTIDDIVEGTKNMILYGDRQGRRTTRDRGRSFVTSYDKIYDEKRNPNRGNPSSSQSPALRAKSLVEDLVFATRGDAEEVLSNLVDDIEEYGAVSVKSLYSYAGQTSDWTKDTYGWTDLKDASVIRDRQGYLLKLPRPVAID